MAQNFQNYKRLYDQNQELRNELQKMRSWREAALQLEQENARLLDLNKVKLNPKLNYVSGKILVDSGNIFRQSAIINLGSLDGIIEGWAAMDGLGLVGRISGVGKKTSRVLFLTDTSSNVPVLIKPSNQRAILSGDNSIQPNLLFIENNKQIQPGDRILTSGDGGVFPANLLIGQISLNNLNQFKAQLSANFSGLEYLRIIRHSPNATINQPSRLIGP
ncbi:rod shape-determining protein MreC, partial [bacterium]|nr:rod shape-determining protein MreC [bacterium]